jgi:hypothetical protein
MEISSTCITGKEFSGVLDFPGSSLVIFRREDYITIQLYYI